MDIFLTKLVILTSVLALLNFGPTAAGSKNKMTFERTSCRSHTPNARVHCRIKYIDRVNLKVDVEINASKPLESLWVEATPYYRYNTYQPIARNLWENVCGWLDRTTKSYILDWTVGRMLNYTNLMNHSCPLLGRAYFKVDNISMDTFAFPSIMPSGRYRLDIVLTGSDRKKILGSAQFFSSISDHRIEVV